MRGHYDVFISWRKRPILGDKPAAIFLGDPRSRNSDVAEPWKPLRCEHRGHGRVAWTAVLIHATRKAGKPTQQILNRFAAIRSCCLADPFIRVAWWHDFHWTVRAWGDVEIYPMSGLIARDRAGMVAKALEVVPRPTRSAAAKFEAYRLAKKAEHDAFWEPVYEAFASGSGGFRARGRTREDPSWGAPPGDPGFGFGKPSGGFGGFGSTPPRPDPDLAALGLAAGATVEAIRARWRDLAKLHHPDTGGVEAEFIRLRAAYDRAME